MATTSLPQPSPSDVSGVLESIAARIKAIGQALREMNDGSTIQFNQDHLGWLYDVLLDALDREYDAMYRQIDQLCKMPKAVA